MVGEVLEALRGSWDQKKKINSIDKRRRADPISAAMLLSEQPLPACELTLGSNVPQKAYTQKLYCTVSLVTLSTTAIVIRYQ